MSHLSPVQLADLCKGDLAQAQLGRAWEHLGGCEQCTRAHARVKGGLVAMSEIAKQEAPELAWDHISARIYWSTSSDQRAKERRPSRQSRPWRLALAGVAGVGLIAGLLLWQQGRAEPTQVASVPIVTNPSPEPVLAAPAPTPLQGLVVLAEGVPEGIALNEPVVAGSEFSTNEGRLVIQFGDHSAFRVAPHSTLAIERLDSERIALRIEGRVDVDITRRLPDQEFVVLAGRHEVQVRGTAFRVDYATGDLDVQCIRGKVVVSDGARGVDVSAGQRFATLRALPIDSEKLAALDKAMRMPMLQTWQAPAKLIEATALLELQSGDLPIAIDGTYIADGSFTLRTTPGSHEVAIVDRDGGIPRGQSIATSAGHRALKRIVSNKAASKDRSARKRELRAAIEESSRAERCLAPLAKQRMLEGSYLTLEVGINPDGSQSFLNLQGSNLSSAIQSCLRDAVDAEQLGAGPAASFRIRLSY